MDVSRWIYFVWVLGWLVGCVELSAGTDDARTASLPIACSPEQPIARAGSQVTVRAWASTSDELRYFWTVEAGRIVKQGVEASWDLTGVQQNSFPYTATVRIVGPGGMTADCTLRVFVASPEYGTEGGVRGGREVGRSLLPPDTSEAEGYGLYSYLLFGASPEGEARERYLKAIEAYFRLIPGLAGLEKYFQRSQLNIMYLPIAQKLPPDAQAVTAEWALDNYNYTHTRYLVRALPGPNRAGPYLVSTLRPLGQTTVMPEQYLLQDLSTVPPQLVSLWVREFLNQTAQQDLSQEGTSVLVLRLRTTIARLATALPEVEAALKRLGLPDIGTVVKTWIAWHPPR